jgi:uncharacterized protein YbjT (DUF2867 family)
LRVAGRSDAHLPYIPIVGVDRIPLGYYRERLAMKEPIAASGKPYTILRATQFHDDLILRLFTTQRAQPSLIAPPDSGSSRLTPRQARAGSRTWWAAKPHRRAADIGGPKLESVSELARQYLRAPGGTGPSP